MEGKQTDDECCAADSKMKVEESRKRFDVLLYLSELSHWDTTKTEGRRRGGRSRSSLTQVACRKGLRATC